MVDSAIRYQVMENLSNFSWEAGFRWMGLYKSLVSPSAKQPSLNLFGLNLFCTLVMEAWG